MPQGLHLSQRLTQSLVLAPQLQQSLVLLQAPTLELKTLVEQELQQNPILEETTNIEVQPETKETRDDGEMPAATVPDPTEPRPDETFDPATDKGDRVVDDFQAEFE